ncbi:MAG: hypothetical protein ABSG14_10500 [Verrucomicrobiia bacterium]|jgi:hypothetical protein
MKSAGVGGGMGNGQWTMANVQDAETLRRDRRLGWQPAGKNDASALIERGHKGDGAAGKSAASARSRN